MDKIELTQIVKEVQNDIGKFELLYKNISSRVYYWCYIVIGNEAEAQDVAQEAMIRIYNKIHTLKNPETFNSWMYRLVRNYCLNYIRLHKKKEFGFSDSKDFSGDSEANVVDERRDHLPHEAYDLKETKQLIGEFVDKLPTMQREVITLFYLEEMKVDEIANVLGYKKGSVKSRLFDGRKNLEKQIHDYQEKNDVRLYNIALIPMLGLIINESYQNFTKKNTLNFNESNFPTNKSIRMKRIMEYLSNNLFASVFATVIIISLLVITANLLAGKEKLNTASIDSFNSPNISKYLDMKNKKDGYQFFESVEYLNFPTKSSVDVTIKLQKEVDVNKIKIMYKGEEMAFKKNNLILTFSAESNGEYQLNINNEVKVFTIDVIDKNAPELLSITKYEDYLQLHIDDKENQINYTNSYVEYNGKKYLFTASGKVYGNFGDITIVLSIDDNRYIEYTMTIK